MKMPIASRERMWGMVDVGRVVRVSHSLLRILCNELAACMRSGRRSARPWGGVCSSKSETEKGTKVSIAWENDS
jgi:hypothetical protein